MCLGIPGQVIAISSPEDMMGIVEVSRVRREVNLACVVSDDRPIEACIGDWVLVHVGFAISRIDPAEAAWTLAMLSEIGAIESELGSMMPDPAEASAPTGDDHAGR
jgi:hydrogenase expression/formation protein HypC